LSPCANTATRTFFPVPAGQHDRAAHRLVGFLRIDAEIDRKVDRLVELGDRRFLDELQRFVNRIGLVVVDLAADDLHPLRQLGFLWSAMITSLLRP
jgi:hypothetical protein